MTGHVDDVVEPSKNPDVPVSVHGGAVANQTFQTTELSLDTRARSASGALETVPWVRVVNLSRALEEIAEAQYWRIGLMGDTETTLASTLDGSKVALVLGSEGDGMRHNVMEHCDVLAKLPISPRMESLNISNAAAIALYAVATAQS